LPVVSVVFVLVVEELVEEELLPPQPAIAKLEARTARSVSMAASGVLFMVGRTPFRTRLRGRPAYQGTL
jgi:hypothetical protein